MTTTTEENPTALAEDAPDVLDEFERAMLDLEGQRFKYTGIKRDAIAKLMVEHGYRDHSPDIRFYQILNQLINRPAAWEPAPALMKVLAERRQL